MHKFSLVFPYQIPFIEEGVTVFLEHHLPRAQTHPPRHSRRRPMADIVMEFVN